MNSKTARLIRRTCIPYREAKRKWLKTPWNKRAALRKSLKEELADLRTSFPVYSNVKKLRPTMMTIK